MKIGIFDSGCGGRFTLEKCKKLLPEHNFVGFFDHKNAPYGGRSVDEIFELTKIGVNNLFDQKCQLVLIACNTAASQALRQLQESQPQKKILGCLIPAVETAIDTSLDKSLSPKRPVSIGVIATEYTVSTKKYQREAFKVDPRVKIFPTATPKLVPWIESISDLPPDKGELKGVWLNIEKYLQQHIQALIDEHSIDTLILGCTHYSALKTMAEKMFPRLRVIDSAEAQAQKLVDYLQRHSELE